MSLANSPWPKYGGKDLRNTCIQAVAGSPLPFPQVKWRTHKGSSSGGSLSTAVLDEQGNIYVGDNDGWLTVLDKDGNVKWRYFVSDEGIASSAAIGSDGTVYIGSYATDPGQLLALNPDGTIKWIFSTAESYLPCLQSPTIGPDGTIYVATEGDRLYAINPDGSLKWSRDGYASSCHPPAIDIERNVIYTLDLYAYQLDGQLKWYYDIGGTRGPVIDNQGHIYTVRFSSVYALYPDGTLKWGGRKMTGRSLGLALGLDGTVLVGCDDGGLYAFDPDTGNLKWKHQRSRGVFNPCVSASGVIYCTDRDGYIFALNHEGVLLWEFNPYDYDMEAPTADVTLDDKGVLYYQDWDGYVVALIVESAGVTIGVTKCARLLTDPRTGAVITPIRLGG